MYLSRALRYCRTVGRSVLLYEGTTWVITTRSASGPEARISPSVPTKETVRKRGCQAEHFPLVQSVYANVMPNAADHVRDWFTDSIPVNPGERRNRRFPRRACAKLLGMLKLCNFSSYKRPVRNRRVIGWWAATCRQLAPSCYPTKRSVLPHINNWTQHSTIFPQAWRR
jgi:hypothetical protein